ncbi:MAG: hypothetical protein R8G66_20195 [Cytophagales bacterium]|nr:hypothetical protein [Cytophagales bacterium]
MDPILSKLRGREVAAISFSQEGEDWETYGCVMDLDKDQINLRSQDHFVAQSRVETWLSSVKDLPLVIGIASDEILTRKVEAKTLPKEELLKLIIPQARPEEFFMQQVDNKHGTFVSIIRKKRLNQILKIIPDTNQVVNIFLAPLPLMLLAKGMKHEASELGGFMFRMEGDEVARVDHVGKQTTAVAISEEETLEQDILLSYAAGLNYLVDAPVPSDFNRKLALEEYAHKRFLSKFGTYVLGAIFLIFLINIFFFFQLSQENEQLVQENSSLLATQKQVEEMENYLASYQDLLDAGDQSVFTRFSDELGHSIPSSIQLNKLIVRPLYLDEKKAIEKEASIWIEGLSENAVAYADWIDRIKDLDWVDGINENTYRQGKFQLKITIKSDV